MTNETITEQDCSKLQDITKKLKSRPHFRTYLREKDITVYNLGNYEKGLIEINDYLRQNNYPEMEVPDDMVLVEIMLENSYFIVKDSNSNICGTATFSPAGEEIDLLLYKFTCIFKKETFKKFVNFMAEYLNKCGHEKVVLAAQDRITYLALSELGFKKIAFKQLCNECTFQKENTLKRLFNHSAIFEIETDKISTTGLNITTEEI